MRQRLWARLRAWRIRLAVRLVGRADAVVVSRAGYAAALDRIAALVEWPSRSGGLAGRPAAAKALEAGLEDVARLLVLAAELGDPALQLAGLERRFVNLRLRAMSPRRRARVGYEAALAALEASAKHAKPAKEAKDLAGDLVPVEGARA